MKFLKTLMVCLIFPLVFVACDQKTDEEEVVVARPPRILMKRFTANTLG